MNMKRCIYMITGLALLSLSSICLADPPGKQMPMQMPVASQQPKGSAPASASTPAQNKSGSVNGGNESGMIRTLPDNHFGGDAEVKQSKEVPKNKVPIYTHTEGDPESSVMAYPEISNIIDLSRSDVNVISCPVDIRDGDEGIGMSQEKHLRIKVKGRYAFVKFQATKTASEGGDKLSYASNPAEIIVLCGDSLYKLIAYPKGIPSVTVYLSPGNSEKIKRNEALYGAMPFKKKIVSVWKNIYKESLSDGFTAVKGDNQPIKIFRDMDLKLRRTIRIDGEGLLVKEYVGSLHQGVKELALDEKDFLRAELTDKPAFISVDPLVATPGDTIRIFIFEHTVEGT